MYNTSFHCFVVMSSLAALLALPKSKQMRWSSASVPYSHFAVETCHGTGLPQMHDYVEHSDPLQWLAQMIVRPV